MALNSRVLQIKLDFGNGQIVNLDERLYMTVDVTKTVLSLQNACEITIGGLSGDVRANLLSNFTAWNKRKVATGNTPAYYVGVEITAGYTGSVSTNTTRIFKGEIALCSLQDSPPNMLLKITAFTKQIDKTKFITGQAPDSCTYKQYVTWAAEQMGLPVRCETIFNDVIVKNPARSRYTVSSLLWDIQDAWKPAVSAFIDDETLIVKDQQNIILTTAKVDQFIGSPSWQEFGVEFTTLLNGEIRLAGGVELTSVINPSLNGTYVVTKISYNLASRDTQFYMKVSASPAAEDE